MEVMLQMLQERIKGPHLMVKIEVLNVLLKGAQLYVGGEEAHGENNDDDDEDSPIEGNQAHNEMGLTISDFDAL
jgi:hypothetical protein